MRDNLPSFQRVLDRGILGVRCISMTRVRKDGKEHVDYSLSETIRINKMTHNALKRH
jgi:hypothetical protein